MSALPGLAPWAAVGLGAALGAVGRYAFGLWLNPLWAGFPLGTVAVNALGGLLMGLAMVLFVHHPNESWRLFAVTGVLGGFTTFSAFSAESLGLVQRGDWALAMAHTLAHVLGALACAGLGFALGRLFWR